MIPSRGFGIFFLVHPIDHEVLVDIYPSNIKNLYCDICVYEFGFEIWNQICTFDYQYLIANAIEEENYLVISLEKH